MKTKIKLFDIYVFLITLFKGFGAESNNKGYVLAFVIGCIAIVTKMARERYTTKELMAVLSIFLIGILDFVVGHTTTILFTAVAICGLKGVEVRHIVKISLWTRVFAFLCLTIGSELGIVENKMIPFWRGGSIIERYALGYSHPNMAQASLTVIIMLALYLYNKKMHIWQYLAFGLLSYLVYTLTYSRTGLLIAWICILIQMLCRNEKIKKKVVQVCKYSYLGFFILTIGMGIAYGKVSIMTKIDVLLTGRIQYISELIRHGLPPLIGTTQFNSFVNIDNGYIALLYQGGILAFVWFSYYIMKTYRQCLKNGMYDECTFMFIFFLYAMTESFFPSIAVNTSLLLIGISIFGDRTRNQIK